MRYPVLTRSKTEALARRCIVGEEPNWELERDWVGSGQEVDLTGLREVLAVAHQNLDSDGRPAPEQLEGHLAGGVHRTLRDLPVETLDDPGFWRYLSLVDFWWFIAIREAPAIKRGNVMTYVDGGKECVPFRMFVRAQAVREGDDYELAGALPKAADFWRSHILRVKTGTSPSLARAFARLQVKKSMVSDDVRPFAKRINRLWTNIVFHDWTDEEADRLLAELYDEMFGDDDNEKELG